MRPITIQEYEAERAAVRRSKLEDRMALILRSMAQEWAEMPAFEVEYKFSPSRRWRFDFAWPQAEVLLAIECDGGTWMQTKSGRSKGHGHPLRIEQDAEKMNAAAVLGYRVLRFTSKQIDNTRYVEQTIRQALEART